MARLGLGSHWECVFANDNDPKKASSYRQNFPESNHLTVDDVANIDASDLADAVELSWASFPCQDLSLAGYGRGFSGTRSAVYWAYWELMKQKIASGTGPQIIALENVGGLLSSNAGRDFQAILKGLADSGYHYGALTVNAKFFVPQSRPRVFIIAVRDIQDVPPKLLSAAPYDTPFFSRQLLDAYANLPVSLKSLYVWWSVPFPSHAVPDLSQIADKTIAGDDWFDREQTEYVLGLMTDEHRKRILQHLDARTTYIGTVYRRTRKDPQGRKVQRAEVRFDGIAGALRTPSGGSSRQTIVFVGRNEIRMRLLRPREAARLMGIPDRYQLPARYNDAYRLLGDGVVVDVVRWLREYLFDPLTFGRYSGQESEYASDQTPVHYPV